MADGKSRPAQGYEPELRECRNSSLFQMISKVATLLSAGFGIALSGQEPQPSGEGWASLVRAGEQSLKTGKSQEALDALVAALKAYRADARPHSDDHAARAYIHHRIAEAYFAQTKPEAGLNYATRALMLYRKAGDQFLAHQLVCLSTTALAQQKTGDITGAARNFQEAVDLLPRWKGLIEYEPMEVWVQAAWFFQALGRTAQSEKLLGELIRRAETAARPGAASIPLHGLAGFLAADNRYLEAEQMARRALELSAYVPQFQEEDFAARRLVLAEALRGQKRLAEAEIELTAALPVFRRGIDRSRVLLGSGLHTLALLRADQRRFDEAIGHMEEAGAILAQWFTQSHPAILRHQYKYVGLLRAAGKKREAKALKKSFDAGVRTWQAQSPATHTLDARAFR